MFFHMYYNLTNYSYFNPSPTYLGRYIPQLQILFTRFNISFIEKELGNGECSDTFLQIGHHLRLLFLAEGHDAEGAVRIYVGMNLDGSDKAVLHQAFSILPVYPKDGSGDFVFTTQLFFFHVRIDSLDALTSG